MRDTTIMADSKVGDDWIREACAANPVQFVMGENGQPNGNLLTGPVRLVFPELLKAVPKMKTDPNSKLGFSTGVLFTPFTDMTLFWQEYYRIAATEFPAHFVGGQYVGLDNPFYDQGTKIPKGYKGYTSGLWACNMSSQFPPGVIDTRGNPITDEKRIYPGVWAIISCNAYASGKTQPKKGPRFGLVSVVLIGDDTPLGAGAPDPRSQFKSVQVKPPVGVPAAFGQATAPGVPGMPGAAAISHFMPTSAPGGPPQARPGLPPNTMMAPMGPPPAPGTGDEDLSQFA